MGMFSWDCKVCGRSMRHAWGGPTDPEAWRGDVLGAIIALLNAEGDEARGAAQRALVAHGLTNLTGRLCALVDAARERGTLRTELEGDGARLCATSGAEHHRWYSYDPDNGFEEHSSPEMARTAAQGALDLYRDDAGDGWAEDVEHIGWGRLIPYGMIRQTNLVRREDDTTGHCERAGVDFCCDYELHTVRDPQDAELLAPRAPNAASNALDDIAALCEAPGWEYPGQVVRDVQGVVERLARLEALHGMRESWPTRDVLAELAAAAQHLLTDHDCDNHGWEKTDQAVSAALGILARWEAFPRPATVEEAVAFGRGRAGLARALHAAARELLDAKAALPLGAATEEVRKKAAARMKFAELMLAALVEVPHKGAPPTDASEILRLRAAARAVSLAIGHISNFWAGRAVETLERALDPAWYAAQDGTRAARATLKCTGIFARWCPRCGDCTCPGDPDRGDPMDDPRCPLHASSSPHGDDGSDENVAPGLYGAQAFQRAAVDECRAMESFLRDKGDVEKANGVRMIGDLLDAFAPTGMPGVVTHA